jgi:hypothetical protein
MKEMCVRACTSCPGAEKLKVLLYNDLDNMTIEYKLWVMTQATLTTVTRQSVEVTEILVSKILLRSISASHSSDIWLAMIGEHLTIWKKFPAATGG